MESLVHLGDFLSLVKDLSEWSIVKRIRRFKLFQGSIIFTRTGFSG